MMNWLSECFFVDVFCRMYARITFKCSSIVLLFNFSFFRVGDGVVGEVEKSLDVEKPAGEEDVAVNGEKETEKNEVEEKEPEDKVSNHFNNYVALE